MNAPSDIPAAERRVIGIDLGGTKLAAGVVSGDLVVHHRAHRFSRGASQSEVLDRLIEVVEELVVANEGETPIEAVGMGIPSLIDQRTGRAVMSVNLPIADVPIRDLMSERLGLPVAIDNDGNVAALAEQRFGAARGKKHVVLLTLGTGVGGGIVIDGKVFRGAIGSGAELGHITVLADGPPCQGFCPNRGCLETMSSGTAIARYANEYADANPESALAGELSAGREITGAVVTDMAHSGDTGSIEVLAKAGHYLGAGLVGLSNTFNPEAFVIGGGAAAAGDFILDPARKHLAEFGLSPNKEMAPVLPAHFGAEAGMLGAAALAFVEALGEPLEDHL
jgi:glucokinase